MNSFHRSRTEIDLATLHYISFIELLGVLPTEAMLLDSEQFTNNSSNMEFESKMNDPFLLFEEHFFAAILVCKKLMKFNSKTYPMKFLSSSHKYKNSGNFLCIIKFTTANCS
jgi:hypothetical protein